MSDCVSDLDLDSLLGDNVQELSAEDVEKFLL